MKACLLRDGWSSYYGTGQIILCVIKNALPRLISLVAFVRMV